MSKFIALLISLTAVIALLTSFTTNLKQNPGIEIPKNVEAIFSKSCLGCHSATSKNYKAKMKLKLDELGSMKTSKLVSKLSKIAKEIEKGNMPTKKFRAKYPEKVPTEEENKLLVDWARSAASKLAGE